MITVSHVLGDCLLQFPVTLAFYLTCRPRRATTEQVMELLDSSAICDTPPLLAVEIVSPESVQRDYRYKRSEYAALGIAEYWIVDPIKNKISILLWEE